MLFTGSTYAIFLALTYVVFWSLRTRRVLRALFLVIASYTFYVWGTYETVVRENQDVPFGAYGWSALCLGVIFVGSSLDYGLARLLHRTETPWKRKGLLLLSVSYYLGVLAIFKYYDFAADSIASLLSFAGASYKPKLLHLVLPFGISFFTFETMSYTIDVYRRELEPAKSYLDYLLFVCFFPHLVAGPIVRPHTMLPQLAAEPKASDEKRSEGLYLIAKGLVKKVTIGDYLSSFVVSGLFERPETYSSLETLVGVYAYAIKIYADFSGYTDVAIGSAKLFGYDLPQNFDRPYLSSNLQEFWHRWHISLSSWLRDYLYIPLGGSRGSSIATYRNLMLTMVLGGLWHGASWNFVIWGALHGGALAVTRAYQRRRGAHPSAAPLRILSQVLTFHYVCFAWIFFNAKTFGLATDILRNFGTLTFGFGHIPMRAVLVLGCGVALHVIPKKYELMLRDFFGRSPAVFQGAALAAAAYLLHFTRGERSLGFIYGQF
ncbi:MAG: MBOAT family O-acyltransferase [Polyangiaceae bacterium]